MATRKRVYRYGKRQAKPTLRKATVVWMLLGVALLTATIVVLAQFTSSADRPLVRPAAPFANAVEKRAVNELHDFGYWLKQNEAKGFIGEFGWPAHDAQWGAVAERWYQAADSYDLWATAWAGGSWWSNYPLGFYTRTGKAGLDTAAPGAAIIERYAANKYGDRRGINLAGMEFGAAVPGKAGTDYFYEPASSFAFLADRGITTVRLPFRWERVQPVLGEPLARSEIAAIRTMLDAARKHDIGVILDLHNYGAYQQGGTELKLGDGILSQDHLADVWVKLHAAFGNHSAVIGYGLMNEPHDLPSGTQITPAKNWEAASQAVVNALRSAGSKQTIMAAGYDWSSLARWSAHHPKAWIQDPANNIRYEAHHYWDKDGSGRYEQSFDQETVGVH